MTGSAVQLPQRRLGSRGPRVGALGFGAMGLSGIYGPADDRQSHQLIRHAVDAGMTLIDTSDVYGDGHNETLVGTAIAGRRDEVVLATKFGAQGLGLGTPAKVRAALEASLRRLGTDHVDVYYIHRVDSTTPIEETAGAMGDLVREGKVRHLGICEVGAETLRRATATFPITVVQQEYSLLSREPEQWLLGELSRHGAALVAYSPLSRGLLTGRYRSPADLPADDRRRSVYPRFLPQNLRHNLTVVERLRDLAAQLHSTPGALALGWVLSKGPTVIPIVGTRSLANLDADIDAARTALDPEVVERLDALFPPGVASGDRYNPEMSRRLNQ